MNAVRTPVNKTGQKWLESQVIYSLVTRIVASKGKEYLGVNKEYFGKSTLIINIQEQNLKLQSLIKCSMFNTQRSILYDFPLPHPLPM
jgi:hypothetical protein